MDPQRSQLPALSIDEWGVDSAASGSVKLVPAGVQHDSLRDVGRRMNEVLYRSVDADALRDLQQRG